MTRIRGHAMAAQRIPLPLGEGEGEGFGVDPVRGPAAMGAHDAAGRTLTQPSHPGRRLSRRGFTLVEMLVVMMVALAFVSLSGLVLRSTLRVTREAQVGQERQTIESRLIEVLRRDTWTAYEMRAGDDQTLLIRMNGERSAVWQVLEGEPDDGGDGKPGDPTRTIRRTAFNGRTKINERTWELRRDALTFTVDGGVLVVRRTDGPLGELYSVRLYSQMAVFAGAASGGER